LDDGEHEERQGACVFLPGPARRGLVPDHVVVSDEAMCRDVGDVLGGKTDVVVGQRQFAVAVFWVRVSRRDGV